MMNIKSASVAVISLAVGLVAGYCLKPSSPTPPSAEAASSAPVRTKVAPDRGEEASNRALRRRVRELESRLSEQMQTEVATNAVAVRERSEERGGNWMRRGQEMLERMKTEDPERYTEITNRMARFRQERLERAQRKLDFFENIDTSRMSAAAKATHTQLQDLIARREELEALLHQDGTTMDDREAIMSEMMESDRQLRQLNRQERSNLIRLAAESLKQLSRSDARVLAETISEVIDNTEMGGGHGPGNHGRHGGGRPPR